ncbi:MAG: Uma2 family endonuclease [Cyanobacteriota bacterium]|nr:Uma2 family endonuclease [Cyanobacteriota bacterium]
MPIFLADPSNPLQIGDYQFLYSPAALGRFIAEKAEQESWLSVSWIKSHCFLWAESESIFWDFVHILEQLEEGIKFEYDHYQGHLIMSLIRARHSFMQPFLMWLIAQKSSQYSGRPEFSIQYEDWPEPLTPNLVVLSLEQEASYDSTQYPYRGIPPLIVEIISPGAAKDNLDWLVGDKPSKLSEFQKAGIQEYWLIDDRSRLFMIYSDPMLAEKRALAEPLRLSIQQEHIQSNFLPDFSIDHQQFWSLFDQFCQNPSSILQSPS